MNESIEKAPVPASMSARLPAQALMEFVVEQHEAVRPMNTVQRLLGVDPLGADLRS